jgi:hypothetical protein
MTASPASSIPRLRISIGMTWLLLAVVMLALRLPDLGNPLIDLDEQMYLLVGDRMWSGAIPYVDIWDRKPIGLFLLYALARVPGGDPYLGYQLLAAAFALVTAGLLAVFARRLANGWAGLAAGALYLVYIALVGGRGGQAPVFYTAFVVAAALLTWHALADPARRTRNGITAMLLMGLAIQVKPTVVFEGAWFGIALLIAAWRAQPTVAVLAQEAARLVTVALAPTLAAFAVYAAVGHADAWWFANVESIFARGVTPHEPIAAHLSGLALVFAAPLIACAYALVRSGTGWFATGWLGSSLVGLLALPPYYNHYALPLVAPVALLAGVGVARSHLLALAVGGASLTLLLLSGYPHRGETVAARASVAHGAATINRYRGAGCLFVFQAPPVFYEATRSCLLTRYAFSTHLAFGGESHAIGINPVAEVRRILATLPTVIMTTAPRGDVNRATFALVKAALARDYRRVGAERGYAIYALRRRPADIP